MSRKFRKRRFVEPAEKVLKAVSVVSPDGKRTTPAPKTAAETYALAAESLAFNLQRLEQHLAQHRIQFEGPEGIHGRNWGFVGDLARINQLLGSCLGEDD